MPSRASFNVCLVAGHDRLWQCQKTKYEWHKKKSRKSFAEGLGRWMSVIIDGMDQDKSHIPRCYSQAKDLKALEPLDVSIIGVIVHGFEQRCYVVKPNWKHDTNLTIHILVLTLVRVAEKGPLPKVLYLQMDNCWRENKNQYMFTFLALLVKLGMFGKIKVNFDLVGHTHEDVDQMFQVLNSVLKRETVATIEKLIELVTSGIKSNKHSIPYSCGTVDSVGLWKEWFAPLNPSFHNHTFPHCFKVYSCTLNLCACIQKSFSDSSYQLIPVWDDHESAMVLHFVCSLLQIHVAMYSCITSVTHAQPNGSHFKLKTLLWSSVPRQ